MTETNHKIREQIKLVKDGIFEPSLEYEKHRRTVQKTIQYLWYYVDYKLRELIPKCNNDPALTDLHQSVYEQKL